MVIHLLICMVYLNSEVPDLVDEAVRVSLSMVEVLVEGSNSVHHSLGPVDLVQVNQSSWPDPGEVMVLSIVIRNKLENHTIITLFALHIKYCGTK